MRKLFSAFYNSLYNADWLRAKRFFAGEAWSYFCLFIFALTFVTAVPAAIAFGPGVREAKKYFSANVPDFTATFQKGKLAVSKLQQPYVFRGSDFTVVVDTVATNTSHVAALASSSPNYLVVTADHAEARGEGQERAQSWSAVKDFIFSKQQIVEVMDKMLTPGIYVAITFALFVGMYLGFFVSKLYSIALVTLIVTVVARVFGRNFRMKEIFVMGLYGVTLSTIVGFLGLFTGLSYISFITLLAFMIAVVYTKEGGEDETE